MSETIPATAWPNVEGMDDLMEIALNLHSCWNHEADEMWRSLDPELWEWTQNPWIILLTVSRDKIIALLASPGFRAMVRDCLRHKRESFNQEAWFQQKYPTTASGPALSLVAYFSMEFMLTEALPIYSGGLGNVAGDQLKAASDLGVPVVGVGLLYGQGYFRQDFDADGNQQALYPVNDPGQLPIRPLRQASGEWLRLQIRLPGSKLWIRCWEAWVGRTKLYLLDTNDFANTPAQRGITSELYGGDAEVRLKQEMVLGIGGWRLLRALGLEPDVCHLNEGHASLAILERARCYMEDHKTSFELALTVTRAGNLFTTHTAVTAGFDRFHPDLIHKYLHRYTEEELFMPLEEILAMGRQNAGDTLEPFNMAYLAMRGSGRINGVSKLHGQVSRQIFSPLFPRWPEWEVPVGSVTNGVHVPTWDSAEADSLWSTACGKTRWSGEETCADGIRRLSDEQLWQLRTSARKNLIGRVRLRYARQRAAGYDGPHDLPQVLDEHVLTVGFARRFATYKRPNFLLRDPERLIRLLTNPERPMQLVLAGKAHPADKPGQALIQQWNDFIERREMQQHVVFLSDYDMLMAQELVQGADLWINTPRRPWEACGTSGMKTLVNGGLNFSELDGWWAEAYSPQVGWAIGDGLEHGDDPAWDSIEAEAMYTLLEQEVVPEFYERADNGMPSKWLSRVRESMARLTPQFSASRAIQNYTEEHYLPAASGYYQRAANNSALGGEVLRWLHRIAQGWNTVHFGSTHSETHDGRHFFQVQVWPGELSSSDLKVELYADPRGEHAAEIVAMTAGDKSNDAKAPATYSVDLAATRTAADYTPRIVPYHASVAVPLEAGEILWQR
ncbi:MAG: alpha-glucan family phosphorylase [Acidobacteriaceae bacterium]